MDTVDKATRSRIMSAVKQRGTKAEIELRHALHRLGFRYRLNDKRLPGSPDLVLPRYHVVIFVNGCFWHRHPNCSKATMPKSNVDYWRKKFAENVERDMRKESELTELGWRVIVVWQCEVSPKRLDDLAERLQKALLPQSST
ncbi:MAG: very short patch repair endonuclease [Armatimonadota bacterium]